MPRLYLIRHGQAAATWDDRDPDPGLTAAGRAQAEAVAAELAGKGPLPILVSPLRRTRETAAPLERQWNITAKTEPRVAEIPAPANITVPRSEWLKDVLQHRWRELEEPLQLWRTQVLEAFLEISADTVVVSHFVAINVAVGYALGDDRVTCFRPDNCSCTTLDLQGKTLNIVELGAEGAGKIL
jgi:broad specificity phosphatase PhoE